MRGRRRRARQRPDLKSRARSQRESARPPWNAMRNSGSKTRARLEALGAVGAYLRVKRVWKGASLNLLWALEGALSARPWQDVAREDRLRLLMELEARQAPKPRRRVNTT